MRESKGDVNMTLDNCPRCGKLFSKNFRNVCPVCIREIDKEYELCSDYLRKHKGAMITELSDQTGVSIKQITKFIREGRISMVDATGLAYPCESCGTMIRESHLCDACRTRLQRDTNDLRQMEARRQQSADQQQSSDEVAYKGLNLYKNK